MATIETEPTTIESKPAATETTRRIRAWIGLRSADLQ